MEIRGVLTEMHCGFPHFHHQVLARYRDTRRNNMFIFLKYSTFMIVRSQSTMYNFQTLGN
jgi:hypothetical protein